MFKSSPIFASFSVDDAKKAKAFYTDILGLDVAEPASMDGGQMLEITSPKGKKYGGGTIMVYAKGQAHTPASFTVLNIPVDDIEAAMKDLKSKGVTFEIYNDTTATPGIKTDQSGLMRDPTHHMSIAWFKDPAGNVMSLIEGG